MGEISDSQMPLSQDVREIKNVTENWEAAVRAGNVALLSTLVTDDAVFLAPGAPPVKGREAIEALYRNVFAKFNIEQNSSCEEIQVIGEWAFGWGPDSITLSPIAGGNPVKWKGYAITILRRQTDGSWKFARGVNSMTQES
jgi:uncharacterized protein (TIGR02246 family)